MNQLKVGWLGTKLDRSSLVANKHAADAQCVIPFCFMQRANLFLTVCFASFDDDRARPVTHFMMARPDFM